MIRRPPRSTRVRSSAASDVYKRQILGHIQRGGSPTAFDRVLATRFGAAALEAVHDGEFGTMVALQAGRIVRIPLSEAADKAKIVDPHLFESVAGLYLG